MPKRLVSEILHDKGHDVFTVDPEQSVFEALEAMAAKNVGALLVKDSQQVLGVFSERDYARKVILEGKASKSTPVSEIMSEMVVTVGPEQTVKECMELMTDKRVRHLPVIDDDELVGIVSIGDVVKAIIDDQQFTIEQLTNYITQPR